MDRVIKFKFWDADLKEMLPWEYLFNILPHVFYALLKGTACEGDKLLQYTGLKDKNGSEIYEGDILKFTFFRSGEERIMDVKWKGTGFKPTRLSKHNQQEIEIIGNIYENPDLLK